MKAELFYPSLKWFSYLVVLLMAVAVGYSAYTAVAYWPLITV